MHLNLSNIFRKNEENGLNFLEGKGCQYHHWYNLFTAVNLSTNDFNLPVDTWWGKDRQSCVPPSTPSSTITELELSLCVVHSDAACDAGAGWVEIEEHIGSRKGTNLFLPALSTCHESRLSGHTCWRCPGHIACSLRSLWQSSRQWGASRW